jgi:hypothetical protein
MEHHHRILKWFIGTGDTLMMVQMLSPTGGALLTDECIVALLQYSVLHGSVSDRGIAKLFILSELVTG